MSKAQLEIGLLIQDLREERGMTQTELARAIKTTQSAIARMEKGEQNFSTEMLGKIGTALRKNIFQLTRSVNFKIEGGKKLSGEVKVNSSKNGAVVLLCASLLNRNTTTLKNMPRIEEVHRLIEVLESIGVQVSWHENTVTITPPKKFNLKGLDQEAATKTRSIIMFIGPLLHHLKKFSLPQSGGCKLGSRTVRPHFFALEKLGVAIETTQDSYKISHKGLKSEQEIVMYEPGDTATENAIMAAACVPGKTTIKFASANYMVQDLCYFLETVGVRTSGIGTTTLVIHGREKINEAAEYTVGEDPTDAMFFLTAAIATKSSITIKRAPIDFLERELLVLEKMGFKYTRSEPYLSHNGYTKLVDITTKPSNLTAPLDKIHALPYPGLNMDNLPFFAVIATQAEGTSLIHDWSYEKRVIYYTELDKLGAETTLVDTHRIFINGPTKLRPAELVCPPALRPATILFVGMLAAKGTSLLRNVYSINRGYEDLATKLNKLGASVTLQK